MKEHLIKLMDRFFWPAVFVALITVVFVFFPLSVEFFSSQANSNVTGVGLLSVLQQNSDPDVSETVCVTTGGGGENPCAGCPLYMPDMPSNCEGLSEQCIWCCSCGCLRPVIIGGSGRRGFAGDNASAINAQLNFPSSVAYDPIEKVLYVADTQNYVIRKINSLGMITTLVGSPSGASFANPSGLAAQASLGKVKALALNSNTKELFFASEPGFIAKVSLNKGTVSTISGGANTLPAVGVAAQSALLGQIQALVLDNQGNLYAATTNRLGGGRIYQINPNGQITAIFGQDLGAPKPGEANGDQGQATQARFGLITDLALDQIGDIYLTDASQMLIRKISLRSGTVATFLGGGKERLGVMGGLAQNAELKEEPRSLIFDQAGQLYFATIGAKGSLYRVDTSAIVKLLVGGAIRYPQDNNPLTQENFLQIGQMDVDAEGKVYFTDVLANQVFKLDTKEAPKPISSQAANKLSSTKEPAKFKAGRGSISNVANLMAPSNLTVSVSGSSVSLSWMDNSNGLFGFVVERDTNNSGIFNTIATIPPNQTTYTDSASSNINYCYQIRLNVPKIESVTFEKLDGSVLDKNPTLGNEITVNGKKLGGGVRFFPDAASSDPFSNDSSPKRNLMVKAKITPAQANVPIYFRSFDVNDSSGLMSTSANNGQDNQEDVVRLNGTPKEGFFTDVANETFAMAMTDSNGVAKVEFNVTMQPGDNFKIVATTDKTLVSAPFPLSVSGQQILDSMNNNMALPKQPDMGEPPVMPAKALTSQLLTVWRWLHVEVDSMPNPPVSDADAERNFVKGIVTDLSRRGKTFQFRVNAVSPPGLTNLNDLSKDLSGNGQNRGNGRFEKGTLSIGSSLTTVDVLGNGSDFVETTQVLLPCQISNQGKPTISRNIDGLSVIGNNFILDNSLQGNSKDYEMGLISFAGQSFTIVRINGQKVEVMQPLQVPFLLVDDDSAVSPFLFQTSLMQNSTNTNQNLFAKMYIQPIYDVTNTTQPKFSRNLDANNTAAARSQLTSGREDISSNDFWRVYLQGAFQEDARRDQDPISETMLVDGWTPDFDSRGSMIFVESVRDTAEFLAANPQILQQFPIISSLAGKPNDIREMITMVTTIHEVGHQFGLPDSNAQADGIMRQQALFLSNVLSDFAFFNDNQQIEIRRKQKP